jgi:hypothetical protein
MGRRGRVAGVLLAVLVAVSLSACTPGQDSGGAVVDGGTASRWWSTPRDAAGSTVDPDDAAGTSLKPDRAAYCQALQDTADAGQGLFPDDVDASSPGYITTATAFVREMQAMAPEEVQDAWQTLGSVVIALVSAGGDVGALSLPEGISADDVTVASEAIAAHAHDECGVDLG